MFAWRLSFGRFALWCLLAAAPFLLWGFFYHAGRYFNFDFFFLCLGLSLVWALFLYASGLSLVPFLPGNAGIRGRMGNVLLAVAGAVNFYVTILCISLIIAFVFVSAMHGISGDLGNPPDPDWSFWRDEFHPWSYIVFSGGGAISGAVWGWGLSRCLRPRNTDFRQFAA